MAGALTRPRIIVDTAVAGRVVVSHPHPDAHSLRIAVVDVAGPSLLRIVYGGTRDLHPGDVVPVAMPGTRALVDGHDGRLRRRNFRGVRSEAMLCSTDELGWTRRGPDEVAVLSGVSPGELVDRLRREP